MSVRGPKKLIVSSGQTHPLVEFTGDSMEKSKRKEKAIESDAADLSTGNIVRGTKRSRNGNTKSSKQVGLKSIINEFALSTNLAVTPETSRERDNKNFNNTSQLGHSSTGISESDGVYIPTPAARQFSTKTGRKIKDNRTVKSIKYEPHVQKKSKDNRSMTEILRENLPVWLYQDQIRFSLQKTNVLLLKGDTGSGKSTQIPQFLYTESWCKRCKTKVQNERGEYHDTFVGGVIAITQPRRVAAITLAQRVSQEIGTPLKRGDRHFNGIVGYSVRFEKMLPAGMKIKFVTEGTLLQEILQDPNLKQYSAVIVDEFHERSVDVDLVVGFLRGMLHSDNKGRGGIPLKVVVMSATLDLKSIEAFLAFPSGQDTHNAVLNISDVGTARSKSLMVGNSDRHELQQNSARHIISCLSSINPASSQTSNPPDSKSNPEKNRIQDNDNSKENFHEEPQIFQSTDRPLLSIKEKSTSDEISIMYVEGRQYEVEIIYELKPCQDYIYSMLQIILQLHVKEPLPGDILAFLTGQEEIEVLQVELESYSTQLANNLPKMKVVPLYGALSAQGQQEAFEKLKEKFTRKIVLATNIAETSVTVSGVRYVVDCGKSKVKQYRPRLGLESLLAKPISKVSAIQRAGRAGREAKGKCYRLYTEADYNKLDENETPEIVRSDIVEAVLKMKARGIKDVLAFPLMDTPNFMAMEKALLRLHLMGILDNNENLTKNGKKVARFPLPATYGRVLTAAAEVEPNMVLEVIDVISCLTTDSNIFLQPKSEEDRETMLNFRRDIHQREGDLITLLSTMQHYASEGTDRSSWCKERMISTRAMSMAMQIRKQLRHICHAEKLLLKLPPPDPQPLTPLTPDDTCRLLKIMLSAFSMNTAILAPDNSYRTTQGKNIIMIHPSSVLYGRKLEAIMFMEHVFTAKNYAKCVSAIEVPWIMEALAM